MSTITYLEAPYTSSLGPVVAHESEPNAYRIEVAGQVRTILANGECSPENVEADIANPPQPLATPADIAAYRYEVENGGVEVATSTGTHRFDSRREIEARWLKLQLAAQANPALTQGWKTLNHGFVTLTAADIAAVTAAVEAHVAACFVAEGALLANPPTLADLPAAFTAALTS